MSCVGLQAIMETFVQSQVDDGEHGEENLDSEFIFGEFLEVPNPVPPCCREGGALSCDDRCARGDGSPTCHDTMVVYRHWPAVQT